MGSRRRCISLGVVLMIGAACVAAAASAPAQVAVKWPLYKLPKGNVITNPGAELAKGSGMGEAETRPWVSASSPSSVTFGRSRYVAPGDFCQGPNDPRACYTEGMVDPTAGKLGGWFFVSPGLPGGMAASQNLRLSAKAALAIADWQTGRVKALLGAWIGGWQNEGGYGGVVVQFLNARGTQIGKSVITEPVDSAARHGASTLVHRTATAFVPPGTRTIRVTMKAVAAGSHGLFFDDVGLTLGYEELNASQARSVGGELFRASIDPCSRWEQKPTHWLFRADAGPSASRIDGGYRVEVGLSQYDSAGRLVLLATGQATWRVKSKEEVAPLNGLARYVQNGCPTPNPPGMTPR